MEQRMKGAHKNQEEMDRAIAAIWHKYRPLNQERIQALERVAAALLEGSTTPELLAQGEMEAHRIAGAAGSFGYQDISKIARELESRLTLRSESIDAKSFQQEVARLREKLDL
jgi:HPt (histidine-containing phosphotransfer) domain-containing protein